MTANRDLKDIIRDRQKKTGESYTTARAYVMRARSNLLSLPIEQPAPDSSPQRADAAVLKINRQSARVRILGEDGHLTFRSSEVLDVVPGHIVTLVIDKRWIWRGDAYASGKIENPRIDLNQLGLLPLPLDGGALEDLRSHYEPYRRPDPYAPLWRKLTAKRRPAFEMDPIAWGQFPGADPEDNPTCDAAELRDAGDIEGAYDLLMDTLLKDLRCIDAHAHLGNLEFERRPTFLLERRATGSVLGRDAGARRLSCRAVGGAAVSPYPGIRESMTPESSRESLISASILHHT